MYPVTFTGKTLALLFVKLLLSLKSQKHTPDTTKDIKSEYDYIIVGAGSGGSTLAARLSEVPCVNVLLLEAGKAPPILTEIPLFSRAFVASDLDWGYFTTPQRYTGDALINNQVYFPSGKVIGGSSIWNAMLYVRGDSRVYDRWEEEGAIGWGYKDVLPYFKKMEMNVNPESIDIPYHGLKGPMTIGKPVFEHPLKSGIEAAGRELGYHPLDVNGPFANGFFDYQANLRNGQRCSTAKAYLVPAENRPNLHIVKNAFVTKVIIKNRRAVGVQLDHSGKRHAIWASREVILSAGTVNSAQLLMLSGIGPKHHLQEMNIPLEVDLPVGLNFQDHPGTLNPFYSDKLQPLLLKTLDPKTYSTYISNRSGIMTAPEGLQYLVFSTNDHSTRPDAFPDYELFLLDGLPLIIRTQTNIKPEVYNIFFKPYDFKAQLWCISQIVHPKSRGTVRLRSSDPYDSPLIDPNYFADPEDLRDIVEGLKECDRIAETYSMRSLGITAFQTVFPGCESYMNNREAYLTCVARSAVITLSHQVGTAKMGDPNDPSTVVDVELRVKGMKGLRVVDASVMPIIPNGNTNNPVIMIAEKAADIIKGEIHCKKYEDDDGEPHYSKPYHPNWWERATSRINIKMPTISFN